MSRSRSLFAAHTGSQLRRGEIDKGGTHFLKAQSCFFSSNPYSFMSSSSICISSVSFCISLLDLIHECQTGGLERENNRGTTEAAGWTGGWIQQHSDSCSCLNHSRCFAFCCIKKRSRNAADQLRNLLMLMIRFDRFHINSPAGGGNANYSSASLSHFPNNDLSQPVSA